MDKKKCLFGNNLSVSLKLKVCNFIVFGWLVCSSNILLSQDLTSAILRSFKETQTIHENGVAFNADDYRMPWLDEIQLRTETHGFELPYQEYLVRGRFNGKKLRNINQGLLLNEIEKTNELKSILSTSDYASVFYYIKDIYQDYRLLKLLERKKVVLSDQVSFYQNSIDLGLKTSLLDLVKAKNNLDNLSKEYALTRDKIDSRQLRLQSMIPSIQDLNFAEIEQWILPRVMNNVVRELNDSPSYDTEIKFAELDIRRSELRLDREYIKRKQYFDFAQIKYTGRQNDPLREELSLGLGFILPTKSTGRNRIGESLLSIEKQKLDKDLLASQLEKKRLKLTQSFEIAYSEYMIHRDSVGFDVQDLIENKTELFVENPQDYLSLLLMQLENEESALRTTFKVEDVYLEFLTFSGALLNTPWINYLSNNLNSI